jgi:hypothetical protein
LRRHTGRITLGVGFQVDYRSNSAAGISQTQERAMKRKKTVTPAVRAANLANAQFSTGPTTKQGKSNSSCGALRHGILSRKVVFDNDEQRADLEELQRSCKKDLRPKGMVERFLVQEIRMTLTVFFTKILHYPLAATIFRLIEAGTVSE